MGEGGGHLLVDIGARDDPQSADENVRNLFSFEMQEIFNVFRPLEKS